MSCYYGPYRVIKRVNALNYVVSSFRKRRGLCQTVHVDRMKRFFLRYDLFDGEAAQFTNVASYTEANADQRSKGLMDLASSSRESVGQTGAMVEESPENHGDRSVKPSIDCKKSGVKRKREKLAAQPPKKFRDQSIREKATPRQSPYCLRGDVKRVNYRE